MDDDSLELSAQEVPLEEKSRPDTSSHHVFVGFTGEFSEPERSVETPNLDNWENYSDADSYQEEDSRSIRSVREGRLGSDLEEYDPDSPYLRDPGHEANGNTDTTQSSSRMKNGPEPQTTNVWQRLSRHRADSDEEFEEHQERATMLQKEIA